jgi:hypothetical protein
MLFTALFHKIFLKLFIFLLQLDGSSENYDESRESKEDKVVRN